MGGGNFIGGKMYRTRGTYIRHGDTGSFGDRDGRERRSRATRMSRYDQLANYETVTVMANRA